MLDVKGPQITNKALINEKDKYFGSEPLKPTSLFLKITAGKRYFSTNKGDVSTSRATFEQNEFWENYDKSSQ
jgi:hypothetical protein